MGGRDLGERIAVAAEGIEQRAVRRSVDERALVMLAVDLDQARADFAEQRDRHDLVVDVGAAPPIGTLHAAQDHVAIGGVDAAFGEQRANGMLRRYVEGGGDVTLRRARAHQRRIAARAERQREGIEQDGFSRAGLAGEYRQPGLEIHGEAFDDDDVADG